MFLVCVHPVWPHTHTLECAAYCFTVKICTQTHTHSRMHARTHAHTHTHARTFPVFIRVIIVWNNDDPTLPFLTPSGDVCVCVCVCVSVILCLCVCSRLCARVPRVLVKYSKIDLTPKAFSASQTWREKDLFLVLLLSLPPTSPCLFFSLPLFTLSLPIFPYTPHLPHLYFLARIYYFSVFLPRSVSRHFCACLSLASPPPTQYSLSLPPCITCIYFIQPGVHTAPFFPVKFEVTETIHLLHWRCFFVSLCLSRFLSPPPGCGFWLEQARSLCSSDGRARYCRTAAIVYKENSALVHFQVNI